MVRTLLDLEPLDLKDTVVTPDALHTQTETARYIVEDKKADYLFSVDKEHGRLEIRRIWTGTELNGYLDFPYVGQVHCIRRESIYLKTGRKTKETVYGITSLSPEKAGPARLLQLNRGRRGIENRLHFFLSLRSSPSIIDLLLLSSMPSLQALIHTRFDFDVSVIMDPINWTGE